MRITSFFAAASLAAVMGLFVPGCMSGNRSNFGSICAAPSDGDEFCVPSADGPARAWNKAKVNGSLPIQMWVERSSTMTLDDIVKSESELERWFATIDEVLKYVPDEEGNAELYKATFEGKLGSLLKHAKARKNKLLSESLVDAVGHLNVALAGKASSETDPPIAALTNDKQSMAAVADILEKAKADPSSFGTLYESLVTDFIAYRATEAAETDQYKNIMVDASKATLDDLVGVEQAIVAAAQSASSGPSDLMATVMQLSAQSQQFEIDSQKAIEPQWTRAECIAAYKYNMQLCNSLPANRERCFVAAHAMLTVCLATARG